MNFAVVLPLLLVFAVHRGPAAFLENQGRLHERGADEGERLRHDLVTASNKLKQVGKDKSKVDTSATLTAAITGNDEHSDEFKQKADASHDAGEEHAEDNVEMQGAVRDRSDADEELHLSTPIRADGHGLIEGDISHRSMFDDHDLSHRRDSLLGHRDDDSFRLHGINHDDDDDDDDGDILMGDSHSIHHGHHHPDRDLHEEEFMGEWDAAHDHGHKHGGRRRHHRRHHHGTL